MSLTDPKDFDDLPESTPLVQATKSPASLQSDGGEAPSQIIADELFYGPGVLSVSGTLITVISTIIGGAVGGVIGFVMGAGGASYGITYPMIHNNTGIYGGVQNDPDGTSAVNAYPFVLIMGAVLGGFIGGGVGSSVAGSASCCCASATLSLLKGCCVNPFSLLGGYGLFKFKEDAKEAIKSDESIWEIMEKRCKH